MVRATVKVKPGVDLTHAMRVLDRQGARIFTTSVRTHSISVEMTDEQFFNTFQLYPAIGHQAVKGSYSAEFEGVEIAPRPTYF